MKYSLFILFFLSTLYTGLSQSEADVFAALNNGDATALGKALDQDVEICFDEDVDFLPRNEAIKKLKQFFELNKPVSFNRLHNGSSKGKYAGYSIGKLVTADNKSYRVYFFANKEGGKYNIQEIRFDIE